jgi:lactam utilization protein B
MGKGKQVYSIRYYMKGGNDSMRYQKAWIGTDDNFDKATYQWVNDSTVSVIMSNTLTAIADTVKLYSDNGSSGIMTK